jgi:hypothetical protein
MQTWLDSLSTAGAISGYYAGYYDSKSSLPILRNQITVTVILGSPKQATGDTVEVPVRFFVHPNGDGFGFGRAGSSLLVRTGSDWQAVDWLFPMSMN